MQKGTRDIYSTEFPSCRIKHCNEICTGTELYSNCHFKLYKKTLYTLCVISDKSLVFFIKWHKF